MTGMQNTGAGHHAPCLYKDAERRSAEGDGLPVASSPKEKVESGATMTAKPSARLRRGEILLPHTKEIFQEQIYESILE